MSQAEVKEHKVAHHFTDAGQEFESAKLGMWLFLAQEIIFFGGLFVAYGVFRSLYPEMFGYGSDKLNVMMGSINTVFLITSSFTMVMAVRFVQINQSKKAIWYLLGTFLLAGAFIVVKYIEYSEKISHGYVPEGFVEMFGVQWAGSEYKNLNVFFGIYWTMTALHGLHVVIGMGLILWLIVGTRSGKYNSNYFTPVEMVGLYWHLVDLVWIFLFPMLYLIG